MIRLPDAEASEAFGARLAPLLTAGDVVTLQGELGAGKTTLARGILRGLDFAGEVASPTFPIVIGYAPPDVRLPVTHVDLYRVEDAGELEELGLEDALLDGALLVEWPERTEGAGWPQALRLSLALGKAGARALTAIVPPAWEGRWPPR